MGDRDPDVAFELDARDGGVVQRVVEQLVPVAAESLRLVHGDVGVAPQRHRVGHGRARDPDAHRRHDRRAGDGQRGAEGAEHAVGVEDRVVGIVHRVEDDHELVAADACDRVIAQNRVLQAPSDPEQQLVSRRVTERVVDLLEPVDVEEHQRARSA